MAREFLGVGWRFPLQANAKGGFSWSRGEEKVEESIWLILSTAKGERVMEPEFGCGLPELVFAPNTPATRNLIAFEVQQALAASEPRIIVDQVRVETLAAEGNQLLINIDYRLRTTNARHNLVYPFYLLEA